MLLFRFAASLLPMLLLAACSPPGLSTSASSTQTPKRSYRVNPAPSQTYRIRMVIEGAPGPFLWKLALAQYDVINPECLRPPKDNPGGRSSPIPTQSIEVPLKQLSENEYEAVIHADHMLDEDYTGRGVCRWALVQFYVPMKATGAHEETRFIPSIPELGEPKISMLQTEVVYFNKNGYPRGMMEDFPDTGAPRHRFADWVRDEDLFTVTFIPTQEVQP